MIEILGTAAVLLIPLTTFVIKSERRLTRLETKMDMLLYHNGVNPLCINKKNKKEKNR